MIKNEAIVNEELDPRLVINRLKREVEELKNQLSIANNGESFSGNLTQDETEKLKILVQRYLEDRDSDSSLNVGADMRKINFCFKFLKDLYIQMLAKSKIAPVSVASNTPTNVTIVDASHYDSKELKDLKDTLRQRDNEISILVGMLKKEKKKYEEIVQGLDY